MTEQSASSELQAAYDELKNMLFNPDVKLSKAERRDQKHEFRQRYIAENSFQKYGELLLSVCRDQAALQYRIDEYGTREVERD